MTFKKCSGCQRLLTTKQVKLIGKSDLGGKSLYANCLFCNSTLVLVAARKAA